MSKATCPTPQRILHAAYELFAERGFDGATTQEICSRAEANIAAVNYHYGSKENLYRAVWEYGDERARRLWQEHIPCDSTPEQRLRRFVELRVRAVLSDTADGWYSKLIHREFSNPSPLHEELRDRFLEPKRKWFMDLVREIVGPHVSDRVVKLAGFCIHSPLIHLSEMRLRPNAPMPPDGGPTADPEALVETVYTFALGGLHELRQGHREENP